MEIKKTEEEIDDLLNQCSENEDKGEQKYLGMTYEQGIKQGIEWVLGYTTDYPLE